MSRRRGKTPSSEDIELWETVSKSVRPLARRAKRILPAALPPVLKATEPAPPTPKKAEPAPPPPPKRPSQAPAPLTFLDRRTRSKVAKGTVAIDARVDLHGLTQVAAHHRLRRFLEDARASGAKMALVITGKGAPDSERMGEERGVLRRMVPGWLGSAELRPYVIGYEPAGRRHGGEGALYVRIRSRKG